MIYPIVSFYAILPSLKVFFHFFLREGRGNFWCPQKKPNVLRKRKEKKKKRNNKKININLIVIFHYQNSNKASADHSPQISDQRKVTDPVGDQCFPRATSFDPQRKKQTKQKKKKKKKKKEKEK